MNKIQIAINCVLIAAVAALFVLFFTAKPKTAKIDAAQAIAAGEQLPVAYLNRDSVLLNYTFAIEANDKLMSKQEDARLKLNTRANTLQRELADFQRKVENNAFLSRERAEAEQNKLIRKQQELQELEAKLTNEIMQQNQELNLQLADTLNTFLAAFNADGRYQIIFANTGKDNILQAADAYDVTAEVIEQLNARCAKK